MCAAGLALCAGLASPDSAAAQAPPGGSFNEPPVDSVADRDAEGEAIGSERSTWSVLAGTRSRRARIIFGLWALHPFEAQFPEVDSTQGFGFVAGGWFGATFINSYDLRSFIAGVERNWADGRLGVARFGVGYRAGLITGYDERLMAVAEDVPVLPFAGILGWLDIGPLALDLYYVYQAISLETSVRF